MADKIFYILCVVFVAVFLIFLWFCSAKKELSKKLNAVKSAYSQFQEAKNNYSLAGKNGKKHEAYEIFILSRNIYLQTIMLYNESLNSPLCKIPSFFLSFSKYESGS